MLGLPRQRRPFNVGVEDEVDQALRTARRFLLDAAKAHLTRVGDRSRFRLKFAGDHVEQRGLAGAVAADEADAGVVRQSGARLVEQDPWPKPQNDIVDMKHGGLVARLLLHCKSCIAKAGPRRFDFV